MEKEEQGGAEVVSGKRGESSGRLFSAVRGGEFRRERMGQERGQGRTEKDTIQHCPNTGVSSL